MIDFEIFNWYYFILAVDQTNKFDEIYSWNFSILEKNMKPESIKV